MRNLHARGGLVGLGLGLGLVLGGACPAAAEVLRPAATLRPERGFIDDALALTPDGATLYYVSTDGATFAELRSVKVAGQSGALASEVSLTGLKLSTSAVVPLPESRVLVVETDPEGQHKTAQAYSLPKKAALPTRLGPATAIVSATVSGAPVLLTYSAPGSDHRFQTMSAQTLRPLSDKRYRSLPGGEVAVPGGNGSFLYVGEGYQTIAVKQAGDYDKKADVRQPDRLAILDTLSGKVRRTEPIADPSALAEQQQVLKDHPGEAAFVHLDEGRGSLELWTTAGGAVARSPLKMPRPLATYNAPTLRYQPVGEGQLLVSLTVDPVNEAAVARKKSDPDTLDLCLVRLGDRSVRCLGEIPGKERPSSWTAAADGTLVLLRKHKGFSRGGAELEVYRLDLGGAQKADAKGGAAP